MDGPLRTEIRTSRSGSSTTRIATTTRRDTHTESARQGAYASQMLLGVVERTLSRLRASLRHPSGIMCINRFTAGAMFNEH